MKDNTQFKKISQNSQRTGFTIIELIVVFAIIAILASVLMFLINQPKENAENANIKANIQTIRKQSEIYFITNSTQTNSYGNGITSCNEGIFADNIVHSALVVIGSNLDTPKTITCQTGLNGNTWAILLENLNGESDPYCVDSSGFAGEASLDSGSCISS